MVEKPVFGTESRRTGLSKYVIAQVAKRRKLYRNFPWKRKQISTTQSTDVLLIN